MKNPTYHGAFMSLYITDIWYYLSFSPICITAVFSAYDLTIIPMYSRMPLEIKLDKMLYS